MIESKPSRALRGLFIAAGILALFTGFGNMPLYGRYYIADIPGLGWSRDFFVNVQIHYLAGSMLLAIGVYAGIQYLLGRKGGIRLTRFGAIRAAVLGLALASGVMLALRNLPGVNFPFGIHISMNFFHMGMAVLFMFLAIGCVVGRCQWVERPGRSDAST